MLRTCIGWLHQTFGRGQTEFSAEVGLTKKWSQVNRILTADIEIVVCTTGVHHLVSELPAQLFHHHPTNAEPLLLGYECHQVMADRSGEFDFYCFIEDDIAIGDSLFFQKLRWFNRNAGDRALLQPNRFEVSINSPLHKLYMDGPLKDRSLTAKFQDTSVRPTLKMTVMDLDLTFDRPNNTHSGCFFLNQDQLNHWMRQPYFLDRAGDYHDPMASAATLGVTRAFEVYKPALQNAGFLEVFHLDNRYLGRVI